MVIVMSDRGLYAPWLYQRIVSLGWHPFMRINEQGNGKRIFTSRDHLLRVSWVVPVHEADQPFLLAIRKRPLGQNIHLHSTFFHAGWCCQT